MHLSRLCHLNSLSRISFLQSLGRASSFGDANATRSASPKSGKCERMLPARRACWLLCRHQYSSPTFSNQEDQDSSSDALLAEYRMSVTRQPQEISSALAMAASGGDDDTSDEHPEYDLCAESLVQVTSLTNTNSRSTTGSGSLANDSYGTQNQPYDGLCACFMEFPGTEKELKETNDERLPLWGAFIAVYAVLKWHGAILGSVSLNSSSSLSSLWHPLSPHANFLSDLRALPLRRVIQTLSSSAWISPCCHKLLHAIVPLVAYHAPELLLADQHCIFKTSAVQLELESGVLATARNMENSGTQVLQPQVEFQLRHRLQQVMTRLKAYLKPPRKVTMMVGVH